MSSVKIAEWVAVDWGTSNLRIWLIDRDGQVIEEKSSDQGMGSLAPAEFESVLLALIEPALSELRVLPVICTGMVGAKQGWQEADYLTAPCCPPDGTTATAVQSKDPRISVHILPGIKQTSPPDVMRGEETQIAGVLLEQPDFDGIICLPGTHTKWVHISAGEIVSFQTAMTGELFSLLSKNSVLRHSVISDDWDAESFKAAISDSFGRPQSIGAQLFGIRAAGLIAGMTPVQARARLSGLLIGLELASTRPYWLGQNVAILGNGFLSEIYKSGLSEQGVNASVLDVTHLTLSGLKSAYNALKGTTE